VTPIDVLFEVITVLDLLTMVRRDLDVATGTADLDWSFGIVYDAALKLCTIPLRLGVSRWP
jgi:hypothetical protein